MRILLSGATGYIGKRLLPVLVNNNHQVICSVREKRRFNPSYALKKNIEVIEVDFSRESSQIKIPKDIDAAYYLIHSMSTASDYDRLELICAANFRNALKSTNIKHVIYLSGIVNEKSLSKHLASRLAVEKELAKGEYHLTTLRAGIIIGSGSASFEIIRDLVEKLPVMIAPKWLKTKCQPIAIGNVIDFLERALFNKSTYDGNFDIGGADVLTYKQMLAGYAKARGLKRFIFVVPVMTPRLSSYWLYFITATSYKLATALVDSMKIEVICRNNDINQILKISPIGYEQSLKKAFSTIETDQVPSSWKDSLVSGRIDRKLSEFINVPVHGCFKDIRSKPVKNREICINRIWSIGGDTGWYYLTWLWRLRGFIDKLFGGVGLRRGRTNPNKIAIGDAIDFWRVLYADQDETRLLLFAEMKLPGEAWLEFKISNNILHQTASFRPKGLWGRIYWYAVYILHVIVFRGLINRLSR